MLSLALLLGACEQGIMHADQQEVEGGALLASETLSFPFSMADTLAPYDLLIYLRNTTDYPYRNIYFFIDTEFPGGKVYHDTLQFMLSDPAGNWLGEGRGFYRENRILYRYGVRFPQAGEYRMNFVQAMRRDTLPGIDELGLIIRKSKYSAPNGKQ